MKAIKGIAGALALAALLVVVLVFGVAPGPAAAQVAVSEPAPAAVKVGQVTGLTASSEGMADGAVRLGWLWAEEALVYFVAYIRSEDAAAGSYGGAQIAAFNDQDAVIDGLDGGVSYDFVVIGMRWDLARYEPVWGEWSDRVSATPGGTPPAGPSPPTLPEPQYVGQVTDLAVSTQVQQADAVRLSWTAAENAQVHFVVYIRSDFADAGDYTAVQTAVFNGASGVIDDLDRGAPYDFIAIGMRWNWGAYGTVWGRWSQWQRAEYIGIPANLIPDVARDRAALVALYHATDGDNWHDNASWLSESPLGDWYGVDTDANGRVIHLNLSANNLTNTIPAELGSLAKLQRLYLGSSPLTGEIPPELGNLASLRVLFLANNRLTGEIPAELGRLTSLRYLTLGNNLLTGEIPSELGNLASLQNMFFAINQLTGEIPPELGRLSNLRELDISHNQLTGEIPQELGNLASLQKMHLYNNQLTGGIPPELGGLSSLQGLHVHNNQLTGKIPPELGRLSNLSRLSLGTNRLTGAIPSELGRPYQAARAVPQRKCANGRHTGRAGQAGQSDLGVPQRQCADGRNPRRAERTRQSNLAVS